MPGNTNNSTSPKWPLRGRKRWISGIALLALDHVVAWLWVCSAWVDFKVSGNRWCLQMRLGVLQIAVIPRPFDWNFYTPYEAPQFNFLAPKSSWLPDGLSPRDPALDVGIVTGRLMTGSTGQMLWLNISGWALALPPLVAGVLLLRATPGWAISRCQRCGYDRRGLTASTNCPECGQQAEVQTAAGQTK